MRRRSLLLRCAAMFGVAAAFAPASADEGRAAPLPEWEIMTRALASWVAEPPARDGYVRLVDAGQSNALELAYDFSDSIAIPSIKRQLVARLRAVLGGEADSAVSAVGKVCVVRRGYSSEPGVYTAFVLWETESKPILDRVEAEKRSAAAKALASGAEPPAWQVVRTVPTWAQRGQGPTPPIGFGYIVTAEAGAGRDLARAKALHLGREKLADQMRKALSESIGRQLAFSLGQLAETWLRIAERASIEGEQSSTAWLRWEVAIEPLLEKVPASKRDEIRTRLTRGIWPE